MKSYSNKSKKKSSVSSGKAQSKETGEKPRYTVEEISNGFLLEKSWFDGQKYHCVKTYHEENPLED